MPCIEEEFTGIILMKKTRRFFLMKSNNKQQSNHPTKKDNELQDQTNVNNHNSTQKDGFRYDYDDSSDV